MRYELTHDSLARQILEKSSTEARTRRKIEKFIRDSYIAHQERSAKFTQDDLDYVKPYLGEINLNAEEHAFLRDAQKKIRRAKNRLILIVSAVIIALASLSIWAIGEKLYAVKATKRAIVRDLTSKALNAFQEYNANDAYNFGATALLFDSEHGEARKALSRIIDQRLEPIFKPLYVELSQHQGPINSLRFSANGQFALTASDDGMANFILVKELVVDSTGNRTRLLKSLKNPQSKSIIAADFFSFDKEIFTISTDNILRTWDYRGSLLKQNDFSPLEVQKIVPSTQGMQFIIIFKGGLLQLGTQTRDGFEFISASDLPGEDIVFAEFTPDGRYILIMNETYAAILNLDLQTVASTRLQWSTIAHVALAPDGREMVIVYKGQAAGIWGVGGGSSKFAGSTKFGGPAGSSAAMIAYLDKHKGEIHDVAYSPDGRFILTASEDHTAGIWNTRGELLTLLRGHSARLTSARFSPAGDIIFTTSDDGTARVWSFTRDEGTKSGINVTLYAVLADERPEGKILSAAFTPNQNWISTIHADHTARLWYASPEGLINRLSSPIDPQTLIQDAEIKTADLLLRKWGVPFPQLPPDYLSGMKSYRQKLKTYKSQKLDLTNWKEQLQFQQDIRGDIVE